MNISKMETNSQNKLMRNEVITLNKEIQAMIQKIT